MVRALSLAPRPRFDPERHPRLQDRADGSVGPYNPLPTLRPTFWAPTYREGDQSGGVEVLLLWGLHDGGGSGRAALILSLGGFFQGVSRLFRVGDPIPTVGFENPRLSFAVFPRATMPDPPLSASPSRMETHPPSSLWRRSGPRPDAVFRRRSGTNPPSAWRSTTSGRTVSFWRTTSQSDRLRLVRPSLRSAEGRATFTFGNARRFSFSISPEDGVGLVSGAG